MAQRGDRLCRLFVGVDQIFGKCADDAVAAGVDIPDFILCLRAVSMTPHAEALMTAVTPPDWA